MSKPPKKRRPRQRTMLICETDPHLEKLISLALSHLQTGPFKELTRSDVARRALVYYVTEKLELAVPSELVGEKKEKVA